MTTLDLLTEPELRVAVLAARGCTNRETADQLCLSVNTVKTHIRRLLGRFDLRNKTHVVAELMTDERFRDLVTNGIRALDLADDPRGPDQSDIKSHFR